MTTNPMRIVRLLALAALTVGLVGCAGEHQAELEDAAGDAKPQAALLTGDFQLSCGFVGITDDIYLDGDCGRRNGSSGWTRLDLNQGIANQNGQLVWQRGGNYGNSCRECRVPADTGWWDWVVLSCLCRDRSGREVYTDGLNLAEHVSNQDGALEFDFF